MKIKDLTEEILLSLYSYRLTDLIIGTGNSMEYLIPGEINSIEPGHSHYINKRCIKSELAQYGWTPQEYFDILILHINDTDDRPKCSNPECSIPLNWGGRIYYGCSQNGYSWFDRIQHYCSPSCRSKVVSTNVNLYTNFGFKDFSKLNIAQKITSLNLVMNMISVKCIYVKLVIYINSEYHMTWRIDLDGIHLTRISYTNQQELM